MLVVHFLFDPAVLRKLARRGIAPGEIEQLPRNGAVGSRNPRPRTPGSRLLIGPTNGDRLLTVVIEPEVADDAIWHVRTAWDSSSQERLAYHRRR